MLRHLKPGTILGVIAVVLALVGTATASSLITSKNIADGTIRNQDIRKDAVSLNRLSPGVQKLIAGNSAESRDPGVVGRDGAQGPKGDTGAQGAKGDKGPKGDSYLAGAYYSVAYYDVGDTNAGAIATVACNAQTDTAISGGVSTDDYMKTVPVGQSFPGRMDWNTNTPKSNRLDGWVVQFASQNGSAPEKVKVWALCVPGLNVPVI